MLLRIRTIPVPVPVLVAAVAAAFVSSATFAQSTPAAPPPAPAPTAQVFSSGTSHDKRHITYTVQRDGSYVQDIELVRLVDNDAGVRAEGQQTVPYSASLQSVEIVQARVITAKGETIDVPASAILDQQPYLSQGAPAFSDVVAKAIVFPQVSVGARTVVHYRITQKKPVLQGYFSAEEFSSQHDVRRDVEYTVIAPADMPMRVVGSGLPVVKTTLPDGRVQWRAQTTNAVAIPHDIGAVSFRDYSQSFVASSLPSGEVLAEAYRNLAADRSRPTAGVTALAQSLTKDITDPREKAKVLYDWVRTNIRYVAIFLGRGGWQPHAVDDIVAAGYGDCKDKATLLGALLEGAGIASTPVLVNAGNSYWMSELPTVQSFNHMITYVPALDLYLDATERWAPYGVLPSEDSSKRVLHLADGRWATTPAFEAGATSLHRVTTTADGRVVGRLELAGTGAQQINMGRSFSGLDAIPDTTLMPPIMNAMQVRGEGRLIRAKAGETRDPASLAIEYSGAGPMELPGPGALRLPASPFVLVAGPVALYQTPRRFPFPCPSFTLREEYDLTLPDTVKVTRNFAPLVQAAESDGVRLRYAATVAQEGNRTVVTRELVAERLKTICSPEDQQRWLPLIEAAQRNFRSQLLYE
ncbi:MAG: DUF3857 domain-containing protein [Pseudomonadota bacterium]